MPSSRIEHPAATRSHRDAKLTAERSVAVSDEETAGSREPPRSPVSAEAKRAGSRSAVAHSAPNPPPRTFLSTRKSATDLDGPVVAATEIGHEPGDPRQTPQDGALLRRRWRALLGRRAPQSLSLALLGRILAWREQVAEVGDISPRSRAILAAVLAGNAAAGASASGARDGEHRPDDHARRPQPHAPIRVGTVFVREHAGVLHRVMVAVGGFEWEGQIYASLSAVARAITGVRWNGRRFFALDRDEKRAVTGKPAGHGKDSAGQNSDRQRARRTSSALPRIGGGS